MGIRLKTVAILCTLLLGWVWGEHAFALDVVRVPSSQSKLDKRSLYKHEVIKRALELTRPSYGPYEFKVIQSRMSRSRALRALKDGEMINLYISLANQRWSRESIPIKIPLRLGVLSYRLLLVHKDTLSKFEKINTLDDLKALTVGLQNDWVITGIFKQMGFKVQGGSNFDGTFEMLQYRRFDYLPRGIYEVYDELEARSKYMEDVVIEPTLALYLRVATYAYVSPKYPRLAKRIETGLREMVNSGELRSILLKYYTNEIERADLANRKVIYLDNPRFQDEDVINDKSLWYSPLRSK